MINGAVTLERVYHRCEGLCGLCGRLVPAVGDRTVPRGEWPSIHHRIPARNHGSHTWDNVTLAHVSCNSKQYHRERPSDAAEPEEHEIRDAMIEGVPF